MHVVDLGEERAVQLVVGLAQREPVYALGDVELLRGGDQLVEIKIQRANVAGLRQIQGIARVHRDRDRLQILPESCVVLVDAVAHGALGDVDQGVVGELGGKLVLV